MTYHKFDNNYWTREPELGGHSYHSQGLSDLLLEETLQRAAEDKDLAFELPPARGRGERGRTPKENCNKIKGNGKAK